VTFKRKRLAATRAQEQAQVGRELFARALRNLDRFFDPSSPRPTRRERRISEIGYLLDSDRRLGFELSPSYKSRAFSLGWAWVRALKNRANHLRLRAETRARADARLGHEFDAGLQKT
jgi:hypothetical protein